jgi:hypothetical protein
MDYRYLLSSTGRRYFFISEKDINEGRPLVRRYSSGKLSDRGQEIFGRSPLYL